MTLRALSARLKELGRPLSADALNKIENGASESPRPIRRVDADDLVALSVALGVHPAALLLPPTARVTDPVSRDATTIEVTTAGAVPAREAWEWAHGMRPLLREQEEGDRQAWYRFAENALPDAWRGMSAADYGQWSALQAKQEYEELMRQHAEPPGGGVSGGPSLD